MTSVATAARPNAMQLLRFMHCTVAIANAHLPPVVTDGPRQGKTFAFQMKAMLYAIAVHEGEAISRSTLYKAAGCSESNGTVRCVKALQHLDLISIEPDPHRFEHFFINLANLQSRGGVA